MKDIYNGIESNTIKEVDASFKRITPTENDWHVIENTDDNTVYKTEAWFEYLEKTGCKPFVCEVCLKGVRTGFFLGEEKRRFFNLIGAPIEGVGTAHQGLAMFKPTSSSERISIYNALAEWIFKEHYSVWFQVEDQCVTEADVIEAGVRYEKHERNSIDLMRDEEELFHNMAKKSCRYMVNKALKSGITIREATDPMAFLDVHYDQHLQVMRSKGLDALKPKPVFKALISATWPSEMLLLEAVLPDGKIAGTGMYAVNHGSACYFNAAFDKECGVSPNELMNWEAIKRCKARGARFFDFNGVSKWKFKYGGALYVQPRLVYMRYEWLSKARKMASELYHKYRYQLVNIGI